MKTTRIIVQERRCTSKNTCNKFSTPYPLKNGANNEIGEHCIHKLIGSKKKKECDFLIWETTQELNLNLEELL